MSEKDNETLENEIEETTPASEEGATDAPASEEDTAGKSETVEDAAAKPILEVNLGITVKDFAAKIDHPASELIKNLFALGEMVTITQSLSEEAINVLADEFGYEARVVEAPELKVTRDRPKDRESDLSPRPPVVTIMGHVNHGKTLLLDAIRQTDVVSQEAGGITQHIGAYQIVHAGKKITFIDTPGHEAFTTMRARGAKVTDIAILVVAADDGVMPQTVEAINHAKAAEVPIIVAVNKVDKPEANPEKVKQQLTEYGLVPEAWGGETVFVDVSAKAKIGLDSLLEMILLVAEVQELKANEKAPAEGTIIEAELDKARGPIATLLVQRGSLKTGALIVAGTSYGRVRAMNDDKGNKVYKALPSQPVELLGLNSVPSAGDIAEVVSNEKDAKDIVGKRVTAEREREIAKKHITLDNLFEQIQEGEVKDLNIVIKADVQGSLEALKESLAKIEKTEVRPNIVHAGVGGITETDIMLAAASDAIVVGFNVRPTPKAKEMAAKEEVDLRFYNIIYRVIEDIEAARKGMLAPVISEAELGRARVLDLFKVSKIGTVAGCMVEEGELRAGANVRVVRDGVVIHDGKLDSLRRFKDDVGSVAQGLECGLHVENYNDVKVDDSIEAYAIVETPRT